MNTRELKAENKTQSATTRDCAAFGYYRSPTVQSHFDGSLLGLVPLQRKGPRGCVDPCAYQLHLALGDVYLIFPIALRLELLTNPFF